MDLFNKKKIEQLDRDVEHWKKMYDEVSEYRNHNQKEIETLKAKIRGERICDGYCKNCKNGIEQTEIYEYGRYPIYTCALDCKCKDFQKAE